MKIFLRQNKFFLISIGAVPGALLRWQIGDVLILNIIGCFLLGIINGLPIKRRNKLILGFGFCGSLTTFTGWSFQLYKLISLGLYRLFFFHSVLVVVIGFSAIYLGDLFAKKVIN